MNIIILMLLNLEPMEFSIFSHQREKTFCKFGLGQDFQGVLSILLTKSVEQEVSEKLSQSDIWSDSVCEKGDRK